MGNFKLGGKKSLWHCADESLEFRALFCEKVEDSERLRELLDCVDRCQRCIEPTFVPSQQLRDRIHRYVHLKMFGTLAQIKSMLLLKYRGAEEHFVTGRDHNQIQVFWIPAPRQVDEPKSFVILCNQNAAFAESLVFNEHLVNFYHERGINIVAWNYRGCSLSTGVPTVTAIKKDAVAIAQWARNKHPESKIIAHGTSMGGACACHLGRLGLCDFLLADRTFGDLHSVPL